MKAVRIHSYGGSDLLHLEETEMPKLKAHEVLVKINAAGVNPVDWKVREGMLKEVRPAQFPLTLGQDFAGIVEKTESAEKFKSGENVFGVAPGAYAQYVVVSENQLARAPDQLNFVDAASLPTPALTAWQMVNDAAQVAEGQQVLIHGAAGAVGAFAVQMAKMKRAKVIATASQESEAYLRALGADQVIDYKTQKFENIVKDIDVVLDFVGGETLARSYDIVKKGGIIVTAMHQADEAKATGMGIRAKNFSMSFDPKRLEEIGFLVEQGRLKTHVTQTFPLEKANVAQEINQNGKSHGKVVLKVA